MHILNAATTIAAGSAFTVKKASPSAIATFYGTWGSGGSVTLQYSPDGGTTWFALSSAKTANGFQTVDIPSGLIRASVTAGTGISINVSVDNAEIAL